MKHYTAPEMKNLVFVSKEAIGVELDPGTSGNNFNDGSLEWPNA